MICDMGLNEFLIPVVDQCGGNFNQTSEVTGFAEIVIQGFRYSNGTVTGPGIGSICNGPQGGYNGVDLQSFFSADTPGQPGNCCSECGAGFITLVG
jgi:hypothetical protein